MNTPERRTDQRQTELDWATKKAPRNIPHHLLDAVCKKLSFNSIDRVTSIR